ncbi:hypothetical protein C8R44DRAFT_944666 [Mycena epipterygia]|nr:hypothetical protein C8R44DRAFT_944666 [Mycena epipterygia]
MPPGAPYNSFVVPYRIRVDEFATSMISALHLSHTHSDRITCLQSHSATLSSAHTTRRICSSATKSMRSTRCTNTNIAPRRLGRIRTSSPLIYPDGSMYYTDSRDLLAHATSGLVERMKLLPPDTYFFINSWTWVLKAISRAFRSPIHFDRYKRNIYSNISDPVLRALGTREDEATRFHACERFDRYDYAPRKDKPVVYVNPVTMDAARWVTYLQDTKLNIARGAVVTHLLVPLSRHSPLPELQAFVSLFWLRRVVLNEFIVGLHGLDWKCIDRMFAQRLAELLLPEDLLPQRTWSSLRTRRWWRCTRRCWTRRC